MKLKLIKHFFLSLIAFLFCTTLWAQNSNKIKPRTFYKRMEGTIGKNMKVISNLKRVGTKIDGNYFYNKMDVDTVESLSHGIDLFGEINSVNKVSLKEFDHSEMAFTGILKDNRFSGQWHGPEDSQLYFLLHEHYAEGSIPMEIHYLQSEVSLEASNPKAPYAQIELTLITPKMNNDSLLLGSKLMTLIEQEFFGKQMTTSIPDSMLTAFETEFYKQFENQNKLWKTSGKEAFNWQRTIEMSVVFNTNYLLCLEYLKHGYSGSGHPVTRISYQTISLRNGRLLGYDDFFVPGSKKEISKLLTEKLRKAYKIKPELDLKTAGFYVDTVSPNTNLYLGGDGIGFVFNNYEVAPPSMGIIDLFLPFSEITTFLRPQWKIQ
jgi:hypothetical protein